MRAGREKTKKARGGKSRPWPDRVMTQYVSVTCRSRWCSLTRSHSWSRKRSKSRSTSGCGTGGSRSLPVGSRSSCRKSCRSRKPGPGFRRPGPRRGAAYARRLLRRCRPEPACKPSSVRTRSRCTAHGSESCTEPACRPCTAPSCRPCTSPCGRSCTAPSCSASLAPSRRRCSGTHFLTVCGTMRVTV